MDRLQDDIGGVPITKVTWLAVYGKVDGLCPDAGNPVDMVGDNNLVSCH